MSLWVVVGGQYGCEGKGKIAAYLTRREDIDICVRCGGPNSGHSFYDDEGNLKILRQLPTGFVNSRTRLLIPAGALVDPSVLESELLLVSDAEKRIGIDNNTFIIEPRDREYERSIGLRERGLS
jgi:adenylosuccinate synthase